MGISKNRGGPPKWMVKIMENPIKIDDLGGCSPYFLVQHPDTILGIPDPDVVAKAYHIGSPSPRKLLVASLLDLVILHSRRDFGWHFGDGSCDPPQK